MNMIDHTMVTSSAFIEVFHIGWTFLSLLVTTQFSLSYLSHNQQRNPTVILY